ncbi:unnamed protein product [Closterium sp. NIES-64]|nr:unnamed protein product [Closterium sp. NIES-64]
MALLHSGCPVVAGEKWSATKWTHVDSLSSATPSSPSPNEAGQAKGAALLPAKGSALLFFSMNPNGSFDTASLHSGCPINAGEKRSGRPPSGSTLTPPSLPCASLLHASRCLLPCVPFPDPGVCQDDDVNCGDWAREGECEKKPKFMKGTGKTQYELGFCRKSCRIPPPLFPPPRLPASIPSPFALFLPFPFPIFLLSLPSDFLALPPRNILPSRLLSNLPAAWQKNEKRGGGLIARAAGRDERESRDCPATWHAAAALTDTCTWRWAACRAPSLLRPTIPSMLSWQMDDMRQQVF